MKSFLKMAIAISLCPLAVHADQNQPLLEFHTSITNANKGTQEAPSPDVTSSANPHVRPYAAIILAARWTTLQIPVCWENGAVDYSQAMEWTRDSVLQTWEKMSGIQFTGWGKCAAVNNGIRIKIDDVGPHVKTLGKFLDRMSNGMVLNFSFVSWGQSCWSNREHCIRAIAVHEFGHALGFTHEQNRADAPGECRLLAQGTDPDTMLTPYDPTSVMNYCNKNWNNSGFLSAMDVVAVQTLYGRPY